MAEDIQAFFFGGRRAETGCRFNRSMQQLDGIVQSVYRSLVSCAWLLSVSRLAS